MQSAVYWLFRHNRCCRIKKRHSVSSHTLRNGWYKLSEHRGPAAITVAHQLAPVTSGMSHRDVRVVFNLLSYSWKLFPIYRKIATCRNGVFLCYTVKTTSVSSETLKSSCRIFFGRFQRSWEQTSSSKTHVCVMYFGEETTRTLLNELCRNTTRSKLPKAHSLPAKPAPTTVTFVSFFTYHTESK